MLGEGITGYVGFAELRRRADLRPSSGTASRSPSIYVAVAVPIEVVLGFLAAGWSTWARPARKAFRTIIGAPLFTMEVAIGYLGVTLFTFAGRPDRVRSSAARHPHSLAVHRAAAGCAAPSSSISGAGPIHFPDRAGGAGPHPQRALRCGDPGRDEPLAGDAASRDAARLAGDDDRDPAAADRMPEGLRPSLRADHRRPGHQHAVFSIMDYLTTIQFFDFGKGSAMGIIFLILVSAIITFFFQQMRKRSISGAADDAEHPLDSRAASRSRVLVYIVLLVAAACG